MYRRRLAEVLKGVGLKCLHDFWAGKCIMLNGMWCKIGRVTPVFMRRQAEVLNWVWFGMSAWVYAGMCFTLNVMWEWSLDELTLCFTMKFIILKQAKLPFLNMHGLYLPSFVVGWRFLPKQVMVYCLKKKRKCSRLTSPNCLWIVVWRRCGKSHLTGHVLTNFLGYLLVHSSR